MAWKSLDAADAQLTRRRPVVQVWMCGGTLEIAPCSHVGHIFRKSTPYSFPGGTSRIVNHNNARLAEVWLDDWKEFYFSINPGVRLGGANRERWRSGGARWLEALR